MYLPLLVQQAADEVVSAGGPAAAAAAVAAALGPGSGGSARELLAATQKYLGAVSQALQHARSDAVLAMPDVQISGPEAAAADPELLEALEAAAAGWSEALAALMQAEGDKQPLGKGPVAEVEFWRARSAALCGAAEQLAAPRVRDMLTALEAASEDRQLLAALRAQMVELDKLATEVGGARVCGVHMAQLPRILEQQQLVPAPAALRAGTPTSSTARPACCKEQHSAPRKLRAAPAQARDNVKFLSTLERHFKTISSGPLPVVADCLLPLMNALRMVWIMSRHYGEPRRRDWGRRRPVALQAHRAARRACCLPAATRRLTPRLPSPTHPHLLAPSAGRRRRAHGRAAWPHRARDWRPRRGLHRAARPVPHARGGGGGPSAHQQGAAGGVAFKLHAGAAAGRQVAGQGGAVPARRLQLATPPGSVRAPHPHCAPPRSASASS